MSVWTMSRTFGSPTPTMQLVELNISKNNGRFVEAVTVVVCQLVRWDFAGHDAGTSLLDAKLRCRRCKHLPGEHRPYAE